MTESSASSCSVVHLHDRVSVQRFGYAGELGVTEDAVKRSVSRALQADGWTVDVRWGHAHGIDIVAQRETERLVLEAKGEGSRPSMRVNYFLGALGELLQRMDDPDARYGLALPAHRQFVALMLGLPEWVRARLDLYFFLVRPLPGGAAEVGLFAVPE